MVIKQICVLFSKKNPREKLTNMTVVSLQHLDIKHAYTPPAPAQKTPTKNPPKTMKTTRQIYNSLQLKIKTRIITLPCTIKASLGRNYRCQYQCKTFLHWIALCVCLRSLPSLLLQRSYNWKIASNTSFSTEPAYYRKSPADGILVCFLHFCMHCDGGSETCSDIHCVLKKYHIFEA